MSDTPITGLTVELRRTADGSLYQFGVNVRGAFVVFASRKTGGVDDQLALAAEQIRAAAAAQAQAAAVQGAFPPAFLGAPPVGP